MNESHTIAEAAKALNRPKMTVYSWMKMHPEYFTFEPAGKLRKVTITPANLERLRHLKADAGAWGVRKFKGARPPAPPPPRPAAALPLPPSYTTLPTTRPATNVRVQRVGWWCKRCGDLMPAFRLVCRCLWEEGTEQAMDRHRKEAWVEAYVDITVSKPGSRL